jgi:hypothetical protein
MRPRCSSVLLVLEEPLSMRKSLVQAIPSRNSIARRYISLARSQASEPVMDENWSPDLVSDISLN